MKRYFFSILFCFVVFLIAAVLASCGGGGGGGASLYDPNSGPHNGGHTSWGGTTNGNTPGSNKGGSALVVLSGSTSLDVDHYVYKGQSYKTAKELSEVLALENLTGETLIDVYVTGETPPRKAKYVVTAGGAVLRHPYAITIKDENENELFNSNDPTTAPQYRYSSEGVSVQDLGLTNPVMINLGDGSVFFPVEKYLVNGGPSAVAPDGKITGFGEGETITLTPKIGKYALDSSCRLGISDECTDGETIRVNATDGNSGKFSNIYIDSSVTSVKIDLSAATLTDVSTGEASNIWINSVIGANSKSKITEITLPSNVTEIGDYALGANSTSPYTSLEKVTMPNVETIGEGAFATSAALTTVDMPCVETIDSYAFYGCEGLQSVSIPNARSIDQKAFANCISLQTVSIPSATEIETGAFLNCTNLQNVTLGEGLTDIKEGTFQYCTNLQNITIPANVETIGMNAFAGCTSLETVTIPASVTTIEAGAFTQEIDIYGLRFEADPLNISCEPGAFVNNQQTSYYAEAENRTYTRYFLNGQWH